MNKAVRYICIILFLVFTCIGIGKNVYAASYNEVVVEGGHRFLLYYTQAIQSYVVDGDDIYIQQAYSENEFDEFDDYKTGRVENLVLISRCQYSAEYDAYKPVDHMLLKNVGHGQTIDVYNYNGKKYLMISCGSKGTSKSTLWWSTQIGRIEYKAGAFVNNSEIKRLTYLNYSNKKTKRFGTTMRVDAALTPDKQTLVIWKINEKGKSEYSGYKFSVVNKEFDKAQNNEVNVKENKKIKKALVFSTKAVKLVPKSFQGLAVTNKSNGKYTLYISSGDERYYKKTGIAIYKYEIKGKKIKHKGTVKLNADDVWSVFPPDADEEESADDKTSEESSDEEDDYTEEDVYTEDEEEQDVVLAEVESIKIVGSDLQFVVRNTGNADQQLICTISQSEF
nr:helveticin J family class III bacteriocin [uncultured Catonella sp.]